MSVVGESRSTNPETPGQLGTSEDDEYANARGRAERAAVAHY